MADTPTFANLGLTFNDATRALEGGLWQNPLNEGNQGPGSVARYIGDLTSVQQGLMAEINAGQFTGNTLTNVNNILTDINKAMSAAQASVAGGNVVQAEQALHSSHLDILNIVNNDPQLSALATADGGNGFLSAPTAFDKGVNAHNAPHATFEDIGVIFNDAQNQILGGVNQSNREHILQDVSAAEADLQALINADPQQFQNLTGIHAQTIVNQLELEKTYINEAGTNPLVSSRGSNDNFLDMIDIVQGDDALAGMAGKGWTPFGDALHPTTPYQDNAAQTNFWANFMADSNSLGQKAMAAVAAGDPNAIAGLINDLHTFETNATNFDAAQGGIFGARFDNELLGDKSTLGAEVNAMIKGLQSHDANLVAAATEEMHANAADVSGNNVPLGGGTYNPDGQTVADVLSTATNPQVAQQQPPVQAGGSGQGAGGQGAGVGDPGHLAHAGANGGHVAHGAGGNGVGDQGQDHGDHGGQPVPSLWNFADNQHAADAGNHHQFALMWHHA
jgi:hypothetical protein